MNYPLISEYIEAIRSAEDNFDKLSNLRPVLDNNGNPVMSSGNFAVVFKMKDISTGRFYAVKCFIKEQEGRGERYGKITEELEFVSSPYLLHVRYLEREVFVSASGSDEEEYSYSSYLIDIDKLCKNVTWQSYTRLDEFIND